MTKSKKILQYWNLRASNKTLKCTNDINLEEKELDFFNSTIKKNKKILDLGCGDGNLLQNLRKKKNIKGIGIDYSENLIKVANKNNKNLKFICMDMLKINKLKHETFDYIISKRALQNLTNWRNQKEIINKLHLFSNSKTRILLIESSRNALNKINEARKKINLNKIKMPWHNLYLDDQKMSKTKFRGLKLVRIGELFSSYYFISRVLNAAVSKKKNKKLNYNDYLNLIGWSMPQNLIEGYSQLKMYEFKKTN